MKINNYIDHTLLKRDAINSDIDKLIDQALKYEFKTICIHPSWIEYAKKKIGNQNLMITAVFGFPYGTQTTETKVFEAKDAINKGADELDMVINVSKVHMKDTDYLINELNLVRKAVPNNTLKLIIETGLLTKDEIEYAAKLGMEAKWDFIKTSTGIQTTGATIEDVELIKKTVENHSEIKASGGVRNYDDAVALIEAGATRIGTSNGVEIIEGKPLKHDY